MILFNFPQHEYFKKPLLQLTLLNPGKFNIEHYTNGELHAQLGLEVARHQCLILGNIAPPDENLLNFLLLAHTCKKEGASQVIALLPYLAYTRQDKNKSRQSMSNAWIATLLEASGIDRIITVDLHSERNEQLSGIPITSVSAVEALAFELNKEKLTDVSILAPDRGALERCKSLAKVMGIKKIANIEKTRTKNSVKHGKIIGPKTSQVILHDDILDTGGTLISTCRRLNSQGVFDIHIAVTHGLFTGVVWKELWKLGVKRIICTNSLPLAKGIKDKRIKIVLIGALLREAAAKFIK